MATLAQTLQTTTPVSALLRKARRLGLRDEDDFITLAVSRGCTHYRAAAKDTVPDCQTTLGNDELCILLLNGENSYNPMAIRCDAQIARSPDIRPRHLARLAIMEKCERVLAHIARAGIAHDPQGQAFWSEVLDSLPDQPPREESNLPHWSRFVTMPGIQRRGMVPPSWLTPGT